MAHVTSDTQNAIAKAVAEHLLRTPLPNTFSDEDQLSAHLKKLLLPNIRNDIQQKWRKFQIRSEKDNVKLKEYWKNKAILGWTPFPDIWCGHGSFKMPVELKLVRKWGKDGVTTLMSGLGRSIFYKMPTDYSLLFAYSIAPWPKDVSAQLTQLRLLSYRAWKHLGVALIIRVAGDRKCVYPWRGNEKWPIPELKRNQ